MSNQSPWANKIVGHAELPPRELVAHHLNWRVHPDFQKDALEGAINEIGFIRSVTVNKRTGRILDGHLRVTLALKTNQPTVPVEYVDLSEREEAYALASLDPLAALAETEQDCLEEVINSAQAEDRNVQLLFARLSREQDAELPDFKPATIEEQGRLDEKQKVTCPECGHEFTP